MLSNIFRKKVSKKRLERATEHERLQRERAQAKARAKIVLGRLEVKRDHTNKT